MPLKTKNESIWDKLRRVSRSFFSSGMGKSGVILAYHSIDKNDHVLTVDPENFIRQMQFIKQKKYEVIPLSEMCSRLKEKGQVRGCVSIVFYPGYSDFFTNAFPTLKRNNFPATVFIAPSKLGKEINSMKLMSPGDVKRASAANDLIEFMPKADSAKEINASRISVEKLTGKPADILSYGKDDEALISLKKSDAWLGRITENSGFIGKGTQPFELPRELIGSKVDLQSFKKKLS